MTGSPWSDPDEFVPIADVPKFVPGRPHRATIFRWWQRGVRGVRLRTELCGGRRFVRLGELQQFLAATADAGDPRPPQSDPSSRARRDARRAEQDLDAHGW